MHVFLGLGTNLGDREMNLVTARDLLMKQNVLVVGQSSVLETEPLGGLDQPMYLNQVVECVTELSPQDLFVTCKTVEKEMGRSVEVPIGNVNFGQTGIDSYPLGHLRASPKGPGESRIIDIDILFYGDQVVEGPSLTIPHPRLTERPFVMEGVLELSPDFVHPVLKKPLKALLHQA
ncbi:MAG: 2-amino-4-hydroxy-6-hydroxymethyldihydropteridine diphosphokinase [Candidatus Gracilibacteria bacterium]